MPNTIPFWKAIKKIRGCDSELGLISSYADFLDAASGLEGYFKKHLYAIIVRGFTSTKTHETDLQFCEKFCKIILLQTPSTDAKITLGDVEKLLILREIKASAFTPTEASETALQAVREFCSKIRVQTSSADAEITLDSIEEFLRLREITASAFTPIATRETDLQTVRDFCNNIRQALDIISYCVQKALKFHFRNMPNPIFSESSFPYYDGYFQSNHLPESQKVDFKNLFDQVTFKNFVSLKSEIELFRGIAAEDDLYRALYEQIASTENTNFGEVLKKILCDKAPETIKSECDKINFNDVEKAREALSKSVSAHILSSVSDILDWYPNFQIAEMTSKYLLRSAPTDWKVLDLFVLKVREVLLNKAYLEFKKEHGTYISRTDFKQMIEDGVLVKTEEGNVQISSEIGQSEFINLVDFCLDRAAIGLTDEQRGKVISDLKLTFGLKKFFGFKSCEEELKDFQEEVNKSVFSALVKPYTTEYRISQKQLSQIKQGFLNICNKIILEQRKKEAVGEQKVVLATLDTMEHLSKEELFKIIQCFLNLCNKNILKQGGEEEVVGGQKVVLVKLDDTTEYWVSEIQLSEIGQEFLKRCDKNVLGRRENQVPGKQKVKPIDFLYVQGFVEERYLEPSTTFDTAIEKVISHAVIPDSYIELAGDSLEIV